MALFLELWSQLWAQATRKIIMQEDISHPPLTKNKRNGRIHIWQTQNLSNHHLFQNSIKWKEMQIVSRRISAYSLSEAMARVQKKLLWTQNATKYRKFQIQKSNFISLQSCNMHLKGYKKLKENYIDYFHPNLPSHHQWSFKLDLRMMVRLA